MDSHECVAPEVKTCSKCGEVKPLNEFGKKLAQCKSCIAAYHRQHYQLNKAKVLERTKRYKEENAEKVKEMMADWYQRNKEHVKSRCADYRSKPEVKGHEKQRSAAYYAARKEEIQRKRKEALLADIERQQRLSDYQKEHYRNNKYIYSEKCSRRRAKMAQATPKWANIEKIRAMYQLSKIMEEMTGIKYHVDHIIPLHSNLVCGLHVEHNLQVMPAEENLSKATKFEAG